MDLTVISTYRCNSKCSMCHIWKYPTLPKEEVSLETLNKLPDNIDNCNISGGEPTVRKDLLEMVEILEPKSRIMEISTNGLNVTPLIPIVQKFPEIKIRFSLEGFGDTNNIVRGEKNGYNIKLEGMKQLIEAGGKDLGFGTTIQDDNVEQLVELYKFCMDMGIDFATSTLHNGFQFHKSDNYFWDRMNVAKQVENLISAQLSSSKLKHWFRAYLNLGLIEKILGHKRLIPCTAAKDFVFIDPWSDVWACNVRNDLLMGNLVEQSWDQIWNSESAKSIREKVYECEQNCWMVTTARTAMRSRFNPNLPKFKVMRWVIANKLRLHLGMNIQFDKYIDYMSVKTDSDKGDRTTFLDKTIKKKVTKKSDLHYQYGEYYNQ